MIKINIQSDNDTINSIHSSIIAEEIGQEEGKGVLEQYRKIKNREKHVLHLFLLLAHLRHLFERIKCDQSQIS